MEAWVAASRTCRHGASWRIDVKVNRLCGVIGFEKEELGNDRGGEGVVNFAVETDNALLGKW